MEQLIVSGLSIDIVRKNIKNIHLAVYPPTGRIRIAAPLTTNEDTLRLFAISKIGWIRRHQRTFDNQERITARAYKQRESHHVRGRRYLLNIIEADTPPKVVLRTRTYIDLYVKPNSPTEKRHSVMTEWYREELKKRIPTLIEKWEKLLNVSVNEWQLKQMKTKWGSCNIAKKRIWLNLELAKKPDSCLEYILVHEMVHLVERHHNDRFRLYMDTYLPNWSQLKTELNNLPVSHSDWTY